MTGDDRTRRILKDLKDLRELLNVNYQLYEERCSGLRELNQTQAHPVRDGGKSSDLWVDHPSVVDLSERKG